jgi:hypothetical protein
MHFSKIRAATFVCCAFAAPRQAAPLYAQANFIDSAVAAMTNAPTPADFILQQLDRHRIVLVGEPHWLAHDVALISSVIPRLRDAHVNTLAVEWLRANQQSEVTAVVNAGAWDEQRAIALLRNSAWPYADYLEVIREVWRTNHEMTAAADRINLLAFGPDADWRAKLLPAGKTAEDFMAERLIARVDSVPNSRALVYLGFHHAFTRYLQPDLPNGARATRFNDRMGNILWRAYGENVYTIVLHHPWFCREGAKWGRCLPVNGAIDCVGARIRRALAFDVAASPFAALRVNRNVWYGVGQNFLRLDNLVDGYVWTKPVASYEGVKLIPLSKFAPDDSSLQQVLADNPVTDEPVKTRADLELQWATREKELRNSVAARGWSGLSPTKQQCSGAREN